MPSTRGIGGGQRSHGFRKTLVGESPSTGPPGPRQKVFYTTPLKALSNQRKLRDIPRSSSVPIKSGLIPVI